MADPAVFVSPDEAAASPAIFLDCRFRLTDPDWGHNAYLQSHIPAARYAHLDHDLADVDAGAGRHPLPDPVRFAEKLGHWGIGAGSRVIVYDDVSGAMAARAWWLLRWAGVRDVSILDGGWQLWNRSKLPVVAQQPEGSTGFVPLPYTGQLPLVDQAALKNALANADQLLVDARSRPRFSGIEEPIDAVAGHIPGAVNWPFENNLADGRLIPDEALLGEWQKLLADHSPADVIHMCGSGVTACFNLACMEHLGLRGSSLYVESWSGWIENRDNPRSPAPPNGEIGTP